MCTKRRIKASMSTLISLNLIKLHLLKRKISLSLSIPQVLTNCLKSFIKKFITVKKNLNPQQNLPLKNKHRIRLRNLNTKLSKNNLTSFTRDSKLSSNPKLLITLKNLINLYQGLTPTMASIKISKMLR